MGPKGVRKNTVAFSHIARSFGRRVAIDLSWLFHAQSQSKQQSGLTGLFNMINIMLLTFNCEPIFVMDGRSLPKERQKIQQSRRKHHAKGIAAVNKMDEHLKSLPESSSVEYRTELSKECARKKQSLQRPPREVYKLAPMLFKLLGLQCYCVDTYEADVVAAAVVRMAGVDGGVMTGDTDLQGFGCDIIQSIPDPDQKCRNGMEAKVEGSNKPYRPWKGRMWQRFDHAAILKGLNLTHQEFVLLCALVRCEITISCPKIPFSVALRVVRGCKTAKDMLASYAKEWRRLAASADAATSAVSGLGYNNVAETLQRSRDQDIPEAKMLQNLTSLVLTEMQEFKKIEKYAPESMARYERLYEQADTYYNSVDKVIEEIGLTPYGGISSSTRIDADAVVEFMNEMFSDGLRDKTTDGGRSEEQNIRDVCANLNALYASGTFESSTGMAHLAIDGLIRQLSSDAWILHNEFPPEQQLERQVLGGWGDGGNDDDEDDEEEDGAYWEPLAPISMDDFAFATEGMSDATSTSPSASPATTPSLKPLDAKTRRSQSSSSKSKKARFKGSLSEQEDRLADSSSSDDAAEFGAMRI
jgi:hypothetical protein